MDYDRDRVNFLQSLQSPVRHGGRNQDSKCCYEVSKVFGPPAVPITEDWQNHDWMPTYGQESPAGQVLVSVVGVHVQDGEDVAGLHLCAPTGKTGGLADDTWPCVPVQAPAP